MNSGACRGNAIHQCATFSPFRCNKLGGLRIVLTLSKMPTLRRHECRVPKRNPIEKLWKQTKKDATHLKYFPTFDALRQTVLKAFQKYLNDASKIVCVMRSLRKKAGLSQ